MHLESSEEEEKEEFNLGYWNNWRCLPDKCNVKKPNLGKNNPIRNVVFSNNEMFTSVKVVKENVKCGNWIPPLSFSYRHLDCKRASEQKIKKESKTKKKSFGDEYFISPNTVARESSNYCYSLKWKKIINLDWGKRVELHDVTGIADGNLVWGMVCLGLFAHIELWVNEYGNICGSADGTISKIGSSEITFISITNAQLLRKMLHISSSQWAILCEVVQQTKASLKFDAIKKCDFSGRNPIEKLWFFLCKRRHFCPEQCMLVKICGAVKCLREFRITPKLIVQDIRSAHGQNIS